MSRITRFVVTLLAALLAAPALLMTRAGAQTPPATPAAAAVQPGNAPVVCVNDIERQFNNLKHHPEALGFHLGAGAGDPTSGRHYQGISRLPGEGTPKFLVTRNGNVGPAEPWWADDEPGEMNIVELASRDTNGERVRSDRLVANVLTEDTPPPAEDRIVQSLEFGGPGPFEYLKYRHIGGLQMWGDYAIIGMDRPFGPGNNITGHLFFFDTSRLDDPRQVASFGLPHQASSVGVAPFGQDRLLIITTGHNGSPIYGFEAMKNGKPTRDLSPDLAHPLWLKKVFEYDAAVKNIGWPTGFQSLQTTNLFTDCGTGEMYLMGGYNLAPFENSSRDRIGIWKINPTNGTMTPVNKRQIWCEWDDIDRLCNMGAGSGFHVTPRGDLLMYAVTHDNDAPGHTVGMAEFSSMDGYDQDGAYRPTAVPGTYTGVKDHALTLDGTASVPAIAQGRIELFDEPNYGGRGLVLDMPDMGKEDYRHLGRVDAYNDEASSVRWRIPTGCVAKLFDDKDFTGPSRTLLASQGQAQAISNLQSFSDDTTSVRFDGDCDGRVVSWSWDLGNDGSVDATGPTPTVTPRSSGVIPVALTVCSGFGVCDTKVGSLDASAGSVPTSTATVQGTTGTDNWYRSAVTVAISATGDPVPTEIRYSATGAQPIAEQTVAGTSADVAISAQGETTVAFRAVNASGEETAKTQAVKIDSIAPALTVTGPPDGRRYVTGTAVTVAATCSDAGSGVASCPNGQQLDTSVVGPKTVNVTATDAAGNTTSKPLTYTVVATPPAGQLVYVAKADGSPGPIERSNLDGSNVVQLDDRGNDPVFSPDGTKVAFTKSVASGRQIVVVDAADGSNLTALTNDTVWGASAPAWSPDGSRIVYTASWSEVVSTNPVTVVNHQQIRTVAATGGAPTTVVTTDESRLSDPVYRTADTITYVADNVIRSVPTTGVPAGQLGTAVLTGVQTYDMILRPMWSPDGSKLLFQISQRESFLTDLFIWSGSGNPVNISITTAAPNWPTQDNPSLNLDRPDESSASWLPDGRVLFVQDGNVYAMAPQNGAAKTLLADFTYTVRDVDAR